jgi:hypothetical protein
MRVIRSADDVLFLAGGSNDVLRLYDADGFAALVCLAAWRARLAAREALFARLGIPWCQLLAPEKLSVLGDSVLAEHVRNPVAPGERLAAALGTRRLVTPAAFLRAQLDRGFDVYPRTDSHWTCVGAFSAFQWAAPVLGLALDYAPFAATAARTLSYHGDLWSDAHADIPPDRFERRIIPAGMARIHANAIVRLKERAGLENEAGLHVGSAVVYRNERAQLAERLLLFGSSFSDHRAECSLLLFVAALFFREVHFVWSANLDVGLIELLAPDRVLIEMPERFLTICPADDFDLATYQAETVARWAARLPSAATETAGTRADPAEP